MLHNSYTDTAQAVLTSQNNVVRALDRVVSCLVDTRTEIFDKSTSDSLYLSNIRASIDQLTDTVQELARAAWWFVTIASFILVAFVVLAVILYLAFL